MSRYQQIGTAGILALLLCLGGVTGESWAQAHSELWGEDGELWSPQSRLPDFSWAGYRAGDVPIPDVPVASNVRDFGAKGDGAADDSQAFLDAVAATNSGAILIPPGRYVLTSVIRLDKSGIVLRGAGPDSTFLVIPKSLQQLAPAESYTARGATKLRYSFGGAFVDLRGGDDGISLGLVPTTARRGDTSIRLPEGGSVRSGDRLRLRMKPSPELGRHLHAGLDAGEDTFRHRYFVDTVVRVAAVDGRTAKLDQPLRVDLRPEWKPEVRTYVPTVEDVGVESLTFEFPGVPKKKHLLEEGFNAIQMQGVANCWVRDVNIIDADLGILVRSGARFCQVERVRFLEAGRAGQRGGTGHHALWASGGAQDNLFSDFSVETIYVHDLTVEGFAHGNVFRRGHGRAINLDHHRNAPYENLFTDLEIGSGRRMWSSSGRGDRGPHSAARTTVWNIRYDGELDELPSLRHFPLVNIVGVIGYPEARLEAERWVEPIEEVSPGDLYKAQRTRRLGIGE